MSDASPETPREDDYLWDARGTPPEDVARLESLLRPYRHNPDRRKAVVVRQFAPRQWLALAAMLALAAAASIYFTRHAPTGSWGISEFQGSPTVAGAHVAADTRLGVGQWLQTDDASSAVVDVAGVGHVTVQPGSRLRLVGTGSSQHRVELAQGSIEAFITAPPKLFFVDTPSAVAVDYGCMYTLDVQPDGGTLLRVTLGLVKLVSHGVESAVPRGLVCRSAPGRGPGTPYDPEADPRFIAAIAEIDAGTPAPDDALTAALAAARPSDRATLWHLLPRVNAAQRPRVCDALADAAPLPAGVTRDAVLRLDPAALAEWWESIYEMY
jgi:hypothetical protein